MSYEEFLNNLKQEEINYYNELVKKYYALDSRRSEFQPKDETEYDKWYAYRDQLDQISSDYDVHDYSETIMKYGEEKYKTRLENRINEHIEKLAKSIKKEIGNVVSVEDLGNNKYHLEGNNGTCNIVVSPIKASSNGNVVKTRIKISDTAKRDIPLDYVPEKEDNEWIKKWKEEEFQEYVKINEKFWNRFNELSQTAKEAKQAFDEAYVKYRQEHNFQNPEVESRNGRYDYNYKDPEIQKLNLAALEAKRNLNELIQYNMFFYENGHKSNWEERFRKAINDHFKKLQAKVEGKIGEIVKIFPLDNSGENYHFEGTKGDCNVEVILAGGYNIQRLHTRWIIKEVKMRNEAK